MRIHIPIILVACICSCRPPYSLSHKDPLFVVPNKATSSNTIAASTVISKIQAGELSSIFSSHAGPKILSFKDGLIVGLYKNMDPNTRNQISDAINKAPNISQIIMGME